MIRHVDAGGIVRRVSIDAAAGQGVLDPRALGETEIAALDDDLAAQLACGDAAKVIGMVAHVGIGLLA